MARAVVVAGAALEEHDVTLPTVVSPGQSPPELATDLPKDVIFFMRVGAEPRLGTSIDIEGMLCFGTVPKCGALSPHVGVMEHAPCDVKEAERLRNDATNAEPEALVLRGSAPPAKLPKGYARQRGPRNMPRPHAAGSARVIDGDYGTRLSLERGLAGTVGLRNGWRLGQLWRLGLRHGVPVMPWTEGRKRASEQVQSRVSSRGPWRRNWARGPEVEIMARCGHDEAGGTTGTRRILAGGAARPRRGVRRTNAGLAARRGEGPARLTHGEGDVAGALHRRFLEERGVTPWHEGSIRASASTGKGGLCAA